MSRTCDDARTDQVRPLRVARALVLAAASVAAAAAAHTVAGGGLPDPAGIALLGAAALVLTSLVARWRLRAWSLVPALALLQVLLHHGLRVLSPPHGVAPPAAAQLAHEGPHAAHRAATLETTAVVPAAEVAVHAASHLHPGMLAAHAVAVVLVTVLAVGADRALAGTVRRFRVVVAVLLTTSPPVAPPSAPPAVAGRVLLPLPRWSPVLRARRGPPVVPRTA